MEDFRQQWWLFNSMFRLLISELTKANPPGPPYTTHKFIFYFDRGTPSGRNHILCVQMCIEYTGISNHASTSMRLSDTL